MKKPRINSEPIHRDPNLYDLTRQDWVCKACAGKMLSVRRSAISEAAKQHHIENAQAKPLQKGIGGMASFYLRQDVQRAVRERGDEVQSTLPRVSFGGSKQNRLGQDVHQVHN